MASALASISSGYPVPVDGSGAPVGDFNIAELMELDTQARCANTDGEPTSLPNDFPPYSALLTASWPPNATPQSGIDTLSQWSVARSNKDWNRTFNSDGTSSPAALSFPTRPLGPYRVVGHVQYANPQSTSFITAVAEADSAIRHIELDLCVAQGLNDLIVSFAGTHLRIDETARLLDNIRAHAQRASIGFAALAQIAAQEDPRPQDYDSAFPCTFVQSGQALYDFTHDPSNEAALGTMGVDTALAVTLAASATRSLAALFSRNRLAAVPPLTLSSADGASPMTLAWDEALHRLLFGGNPLALNGAALGRPLVTASTSVPLTMPFATSTAASISRGEARLLQLAVDADVFDVLSSEIQSGACKVAASKSEHLLYQAVEASLRRPECKPPRNAAAPDCHTIAATLALPSYPDQASDYVLQASEHVTPTDAADLIARACSEAPWDTRVPYQGRLERREVRTGSQSVTASHRGFEGDFFAASTATGPQIFQHLSQVTPNAFRQTNDYALPFLDTVPGVGDKFLTTAQSAGLRPLGSDPRDTGAVAVLSAVRGALALADSQRPSSRAAGFFSGAERSLAVLSDLLGPVSFVRRAIPRAFTISLEAATTADATLSPGVPNVLGGFRCSGGGCTISSTQTFTRSPASEIVPGLPSTSWAQDEVVAVGDAGSDFVLCAGPEETNSGCAMIKPARTAPAGSVATVTQWILPDATTTAVLRRPSGTAATTDIATLPPGTTRSYVDTIVYKPQTSSLGEVDLWQADPRGVATSRGGVLERAAIETFTVDRRAWSRPAFGSRGEPRSLMYPNDGQLLESGLAATMNLIADAKREADAAEQRARSAVAELQREQLDAEEAEIARQRALATSSTELGVLIDDASSAAPAVTLGFISYTFDSDAPHLGVGKSDWQSIPTLINPALPLCPDLTHAAEVDIPKAVADCTDAVVGNAPGGAIATSLGTYRSALAAFFSAYANFRVTAQDGDQRVTAAQAAAEAARNIPVGALDGKLPPECTKASYDHAFRAGFSLSDLSERPSITTGDWAFSYGAAGKQTGWSPGPLWAQLSQCDAAMERLGEANDYRSAQVKAADATYNSAQADKWTQLQGAHVQADTAASQLWQSAGEVLSNVARARGLMAQRDIEQSIVGARTKARLGFTQRFLSDDLETAKDVLEDARRLAIKARRAVEARFLVDLSTVTVKGDLLDEVPARWADSIYGFDFAALVDAKASTDLSSVARYLQRLEDFTRDYMQLFVASTRTVTRVVSTPGPEARATFAPGPSDAASDGGTGGDAGTASVLAPRAGKWAFQCPGSLAWLAHPGVGHPAASVDTMCNAAPPSKLRIQLSLDEWGHPEGLTDSAPLTDVYNARFSRALVTLSPTVGADLSEALSYPVDIEQRGPVTLGAYDGWPIDYAIAPGRVSDGRAAVPKDLNLTEVNTPWSYNQVQGAIITSELADRPLYGDYTIILTLPAGVKPSTIGSVDVWIESQSWVRRGTP